MLFVLFLFHVGFCVNISKTRNGKEVMILSLIIDFILGIVQSIRVAMTKYYVGKVQDYNNRDFYKFNTG